MQEWINTTAAKAEDAVCILSMQERIKAKAKKSAGGSLA